MDTFNFIGTLAWTAQSWSTEIVWEARWTAEEAGADDLVEILVNELVRRENNVNWKLEGTDEPCQRGTVGCSVNHSAPTASTISCETW